MPPIRCYCYREKNLKATGEEKNPIPSPKRELSRTVWSLFPMKYFLNPLLSTSSARVSSLKMGTVLIRFSLQRWVRTAGGASKVSDK